MFLEEPQPRHPGYITITYPILGEYSQIPVEPLVSLLVIHSSEFLRFVNYCEDDATSRGDITLCVKDTIEYRASHRQQTHRCRC